MNTKELLTIVKSSGLVSAEKILDLVSPQILSEELCNSALLADENVANPQKGAKVYSKATGSVSCNFWNCFGCNKFLIIFQTYLS